jgi:heme-degrading monooxygenase HmoA
MDMVRVTLCMRVAAGRAAEFEQVWRDVAAGAERADGNLRQDLLRDPRDPSNFVITSDWVSREAFHRFERSAEQDALVAPLVQLRESVRMEVHDLLVHVESKEA